MKKFFRQTFASPASQPPQLVKEPFSLPQPLSLQVRAPIPDAARRKRQQGEAVQGVHEELPARATSITLCNNTGSQL